VVQKIFWEEQMKGIFKRIWSYRIASWIRIVIRRRWLFRNLNFRKAINLVAAVFSYIFRCKKVFGLPPFVKIDISPLCNLHCTVCIHARPNGDEDLERQQFSPKQKMSLEQYRRIINEIAGRSCAISLYYLGDPFMHPDIDRMCHIAKDAGLNVHVSSNFSFKFSDERIGDIARSGITHLTVCVDGLSQENYELTRVGGRIDWVLSNLERLCEYKHRNSLKCPEIEVQYIKFEHNVDEFSEACKIFEAMGVEQVTDFWGACKNYVNYEPGKYNTYGPKSSELLPLCPWPYFSIVIKYNGDVIPCCNHRLGTQYTDIDNPPVLGNVFETNIRDIWNSQPYQELRRLVSKPKLFNSEPMSKESFCYKCKTLFVSDFNEREV
jgi:MoaA/NifB/PqqE/SkfB family radical SAM enzyme